MVVSLLNTCSPSGVLNQANLESTIHWRQSSQATSPENDQQNCILNFSNHDQRPSSPVQNGEENSCYSSENGADNLSPPQETSRSSGSEDMGVNLFPISGCGMSQQCMDYSNSDNESSQASPMSFHDDDSFRSGKGGNGSNGKPKVHKCRNCGFSTTNKHESWEHIATHMKPEKILRCEQCPFVTEYKHHLDFHNWNHSGKKPYKCDKCTYVCVNKSMLKSHLKSHSNVYQYRCSDCAYRTKYCHSLKIHLRKYRHEPGMVLDSEGNPNPNPVIDVYGNRRGPKQKPKKQQENDVLPLQPTISPLNAFPNFPWVNNVFFPENSRIPCPILPNAMMNSPFATTELPKADMTSQETDNLNNNVKMSVNNNDSLVNNNDSGINEDIIKREHCSSDDDDMYQPDTCLEERGPATTPPNYYYTFDRHTMVPERANMLAERSMALPERPMMLAERPAALPERPMMLPERPVVLPPERPVVVAERPVVMPERLVVVAERPAVLPERAMVIAERPVVKTEVPMVEEAPLNLSITYNAVVAQHQAENAAATPLVKNRRKGVACKLKRSYPEEADEAKDLSATSSLSSSSSSPAVKCEVVHTEAMSLVTTANDRSHDAENASLAKQNNKKQYFYCNFCEITFFNKIMFTMHVGYHGYSDPFKCNRCGEKTDNKIDFYAHLISAQHL